MKQLVATVATTDPDQGCGVPSRLGQTGVLAESLSGNGVRIKRSKARQNKYQVVWFASGEPCPCSPGNGWLILY